METYSLRRLFSVVIAVGALFFAVGGARAASDKTDFTDVPRTSPYFLSLHYLSGLGMVGGYEDKTFRPDAPVNRAEALKMVLKAAQIQPPVSVSQPPFSDVAVTDWFAPYAAAALDQGIVTGNGEDKTFAAGRQVNKAEFLKMLLLAAKINVDSFRDQESGFIDVPADAWFKPYINYGVALGIISAEKDSQYIFPSKPLTRGETAEALYLLALVRKGTDTQFLLDQTEDQLTQIEVYIAANRVDLAKKASTLAVDLSQQAFKNMPGNPVVVGAAKLARAYDFLVDSYTLGVERKNEESASMANQAIQKAQEAWVANNATQPIARHIKDRAREILAQVGGQELPAGN